MDGPLAGLLILLAAGLVLRGLLIAGQWPVSLRVDDAYESYARTNPFLDPLHPAGYPLIVAALGALSRQVAVTVLLQHLTALASAVLLWAATGRVTGSRWAGLLPAAIVLLDPDEAVLEHAVMSEAWAILLASLGLYAAARAFDAPRPLWRWPLLAGIALALAAVVRTAGLFVIPVALVAIGLARPGPLRARWAPTLAGAVAAGAVLVAFALGGAAFGQRFGLAPNPGWHLYGRAAEFADCTRFTPPPRTRGLCERRPPATRPGAYWYLFDDHSPAHRVFGGFGAGDAAIGAWARKAVLAQPTDYAASVWRYLRVYFVPAWRPHRLSGTPLEPQLNPLWALSPIFVAAIHQRLQTFYRPFAAHEWRPGLRVVRAWQHVGRFGSMLLCITTALTLLGLALCRGRARAGVVLFGVGGLALLVSPALGGTAGGRYTVPMAGPMFAAAAVVVTDAVRRIRAHRAADRLAR